MDRLIVFLHYYLGAFSDRVKNPYCVLVRAESYLIREYSNAAMLERGFYLPEQNEAFELLNRLQKQIPLYPRGWIAPKESHE